MLITVVTNKVKKKQFIELGCACHLSRRTISAIAELKKKDTESNSSNCHLPGKNQLIISTTLYTMPPPPSTTAGGGTMEKSESAADSYIFPDNIDHSDDGSSHGQ